MIKIKPPGKTTNEPSPITTKVATTKTNATKTTPYHHKERKPITVGKIGGKWVGNRVVTTSVTGAAGGGRKEEAGARGRRR